MRKRRLGWDGMGWEADTRPPGVCLRAAMLEFEINVNEMPLGKLSKGAILKGGGGRVPPSLPPSLPPPLMPPWVGGVQGTAC